MPGSDLVASPQSLKLLERVRAELRKRHYSDRTEEAYVGWIRQYIRFHGLRHPREMGKEEVERYLSHLAVKRNVAAATQNQALAALLFLYRDVLGTKLEWMDDIVRAKRPGRLPVVLTRAEVSAVLSKMFGPNWIAGMLMYGAGLRLLECLQLRVKDIDFGYRQIVVREGKGSKDRVTILPSSIEEQLLRQLDEIKAQHEKDLSRGSGYVRLPNGLDRKYPAAEQEWRWQWIFPATRQFQDAGSGRLYRHHLHETVLQRAVKEAAALARLTKRVTCHTFRHSFATHLFEEGTTSEPSRNFSATGTSARRWSTPTSSTAEAGVFGVPWTFQCRFFWSPGDGLGSNLRSLTQSTKTLRSIQPQRFHTPFPQPKNSYYNDNPHNMNDISRFFRRATRRSNLS